jgi:3-oxoacyl-[acyl-carrier protein] reductase
VRFASEGAKVIIADINDDGGARVAGIIPDNMAFFHANVAQAEDWAKLMEFATTTFGTVDILVNNAGASYRNKVCIGLTC